MITACVGFILLGLASIPVEHAAVLNQTKKIGPLYLPRVPEELDNYTFKFLVLDKESVDYGKTVQEQFCRDRGAKPPFDEGETITIKVRIWNEANCWELLSYDGERDEHNNVVRR
jgi:hypothetical protein